MRDIDGATQTALAARTIVKRAFLWITAHDIVTNDPVSTGFWDDMGSVSAPVIDADTLSSTTRAYSGSGKLVSVDAIPLTDDLTVRQVRVRLNILDTAVNNFIRGNNMRNAAVQLHRGLFDPASWTLLAPAALDLVGFVDGAPITTAAVGGQSYCDLKLVSQTRELTRTSSDTRSDASQKARHSGDRFYRYAGVMGQVHLFWGQAQGKITSTAASAAAQDSARSALRRF